MSPPEDFRKHASDLGDIAKDCFGITVTYLPKAGGKKSIRGIFDNTWETIDPDTETVIASNQPMLDINLKDLLPLEPEKGDCVLIESVRYRVVDSQEDGLAMAKLILQKVK